MGLLGLSMAFAGVTGIAIGAGARRVRHPWPPLTLGIALMVAVWPLPGQARCSSPTWSWGPRP